MGLMDKFKKILFDEEIVDVPVNTDELPDNTKAPKVEEKQEYQGFKDYNGTDEEDDIIKEVKIPKEEEVVSNIEEKKTFNLPIDFEMESDLPSRSYEDTQEFVTEEYEIPKRSEMRVEPRKDYRDLSRVMDSPKRHEEVKDYKKIVNEREETTFKKPFKVTPIISPVFGILDKNYTPDEVVERREQINRVNNGANKTRTYGPVSYNDQPLPKRVSNKSKLKDELVELNTTINEMMNEDVGGEEGATKEIAITKTEIKVSKQTPVEEEIVLPAQVAPEDDAIIMTPNYDNYETTSIEEQYIGNNNIEDAFETTNEFKTINELDSREESVPKPSIEQIINEAQNYEDEPNHLEDTIETDLFNLIDSMYKKDDELEDDSED